MTVISSQRRRVAHPVKKTKGDIVFLTINALLLLAVAVVTLWPFLDTLLESVSPTIDLMKNAKKILRIPSYIDFSNYDYVLHGSQMIQSIKVTVSRTIVGTLLSLLLTALTAYPLSKRDLPGGQVIMAMFLFTMIFQAGMIPTFLAIKDYGLLDTFWALIIPEALSVYNMIIMRTFFQGIPSELIEAAAIDGCSEMKTLWKIVLPLSTPVLASIGLFYAVWHWNAWFDAVLYITKRKLWPMQTLLREILLSSSIADLEQGGALAEAMPPTSTVQAAAIMVSVIPIACVYPFLQKYFVKGIMIGSVKG